MSLFESPQRLASSNGGAISFTTVQQPPDQGSVSNARPGKTGLAVGDTIFTVRCDPRFLIFSESYFRIQGHFANGAGTAALPNTAQTKRIAACDNWPAALFQTVRCTMNGTQIEQGLFNAQTDTVATYSAATESWLRSYGSASGVGESLVNRIAAAGAQPYGSVSTAVATSGAICATFRPPLSIFNCASAVRGNTWRFIMSWNPSGEQQMVESAGFASATVPAVIAVPTSAIAGTDYQFIIDDFTLFVATAAPDPTVPVPSRVLIDLTPCQTTQIPITTNSGSSNVSIPPTTFRMAFALQDNNVNLNNVTTNVVGYANAHGSNGIFPITNFSFGMSVVTAGGVIASTLTGSPAWLSGFRWSSSQLGLSWPIPDYQFSQVLATATSGVVGSQVLNMATRKGLDRAYRDFIQTTQGDHGLSEGAIPFGNLDSGVPINEFGTIVAATPFALDSGSSNYINWADPQNNNAVSYADPSFTNATQTAAAALAPITNTNTAVYGWLGRYGILCSPLVKPVGTNLSQIDVTYSFTAAPTSATLYCFAYYGAAIAIDYSPDGSVKNVEIQQNN